MFWLEIRQALPAAVAQSENAARWSFAMTVARRARIVILSGNSLSHNPRVLKAAGTLARAGHDVAVLGAWRDADLKAQDQRLLRSAPFRFVPVLDTTRSGSHARTAQLFRRARRKAAHLVHRTIGWESPDQLGDAVTLLLQRARTIEADLYIAHSEQGLHAAWRLMRQGRRVGVDMEDWFSEDLSPQARQSRPLKLLRFLETELLRHGAYASCPSRAMSAALAGACGGKPPVAVYNAFPWTDRQTFDGRRCDRRDPALRSIFWYSQTLGPGRGVEDLVAALPLLEGRAEVHLRGRAAVGFERWIRGQLPEDWQPRVFLHQLVANDELGSRLAEHDVGFAGERPDCRSRDLTVTNKMLHYLLGGLAVVASDTAGQREVAYHAAGAVALYQSGNPRSLADALDALLKSAENLRQAKDAALQAARETFCWEKQEPALRDAVAAALAQRSGCAR
jgi:glycosyltransferase involved in cell wall biosynthesis